MWKKTTQVLVAMSLIGLTVPASAHHSGAAYDSEHKKMVEGTVEQVNWTNPHVNYQVKLDSGEVWSLESTSPGVLSRSGWTKKSLQPGDHATFEIAPTRTGAPSGYIGKVILSNGQTLSYTSLPGEQ